MKDCHTCMYATHTHGTRKMGQNVIVTSSNSITCTREKVGCLTIDDDGMYCSDYAPAIEGEMDMEFLPEPPKEEEDECNR